MEFKAIALGLEGENQDGLLEKVLRLRGASARVLYLLAMHDSISVGLVESQESVGRLLDLSRRPQDSTADISASKRKAGIAIGSRLLVQHLLDIYSGILNREEQWLHYDLDPASLSVCKRPVLSAGRWPCLSDTGPEGKAGDWPFPDYGFEDVDAKAFLERADRYLVDPKLGIISMLDEGSLLQLPHHQSAAMWRPPRHGLRQIRFTESGEDVYHARIGAIRRVLEHHFADRLTTLDPALQVSLFRSVAGKPQRVASRYLPSGIVTSAFKRDELVPKAFFQAVARHAHSTEDWSTVAISGCEVSGEGGLTKAYLDDIGVLSNVRVQRHVGLSEHGCDVLRFGYDGRFVSVVAGPSGPGLWATGFKDIWLDLTSRKAFPEATCVTPIRFHHSEVATELLEQAMVELRKYQRLQFGLVPLLWEEASLVQPFFFSYAFLLESPVSELQ